MYKQYINYTSEILNYAGININTVPVLDILRKKTHSVIKGRSFSRDPKIVRKLGNLCIKLYSKNKIGTVVKHIPGHGVSNLDSHHNLYESSLQKKTLMG